MTFSIRYDETVDPQIVRRRIVFNPNYDGLTCVDVPGAVSIRMPRRPNKPKYFAALKANVKMDGFRNPIILYDTYDGLLLEFGGSRLDVAKELDKPIPAIVVDYTGNYVLFEQVTPANWQEFFGDVPKHFEFTDTGVDTHYSIERNRRNEHDPAGMAWVEDHEGDTSFIEEEFPWISLKS